MICRTCKHCIKADVPGRKGRCGLPMQLPYWVLGGGGSRTVALDEEHSCQCHENAEDVEPEIEIGSPS